jgi:hypothetical protein
MTTDERLDAIDNHLDRIDKFLLDFRNETANRLDIIDSRLTLLAGLYQSLEPRLSIFAKAVLDFDATVARLQNEQSRIARLVEPAA